MPFREALIRALGIISGSSMLIRRDQAKDVTDEFMYVTEKFQVKLYSCVLI